IDFLSRNEQSDFDSELNGHSVSDPIQQCAYEGKFRLELNVASAFLINLDRFSGNDVKNLWQSAVLTGRWGAGPGSRSTGH
ncbi:hypothetical protein TSMEX_009566, partial [Taenia solium]